MNIEQVLEQLEELYRGWNISPQDWYLCEGWALRFQGYDTQKDMEELNTVVLEDKLPWTPRGSYRDKIPVLLTIPPRDSKEMSEFIEFTENTGYYSLIIHPHRKSDFLQIPVREYRLPNEKVIYLMPVLEYVNIIAQVIPMFKEFGEERWIQDHLEYIQDIKSNAERKEETQIVKTCEQILTKYSK